MATSRLVFKTVRLFCDTPVALTDKFRHILSLFPEDLVFAFAYGSGAFQQHGQKSTEVRKNSKNQILWFIWDLRVVYFSK